MNNLESLKELYRDAYNEEDLIEVTSLNGNKFYMIGNDGKFVSVLEAGYIILENGNFVTIKDFQDHDDVFAYFISYYFDEPYRDYGSGEAAIKINQAGLPVYFGVKPEYVRAMAIGNDLGNYSEQKEISRLHSGLGILSIPFADEQDLTNAQKINISKFLMTNIKQRRRYGELITEEMLPLTCGNIEHEKIYSKEEFNGILKPNKELLCK